VTLTLDLILIKLNTVVVYNRMMRTKEDNPCPQPSLVTLTLELILIKLNTVVGDNLMMCTEEDNLLFNKTISREIIRSSSSICG